MSIPDGAQIEGVAVQVIETCALCGGRGRRSVPVYHNDFDEVACESCEGTGKTSSNVLVTLAEFAQLLKDAT